MKNKVALISGASSGLGKEIALSLLQKGTPYMDLLVV